MALASYTMLDGPRNVVIQITGTDTDTGILVDVSALVPSCTRVNVNRIWWSSPATQLGFLSWDATIDVPFLYLGGHAEDWNFEFFGGVRNPMTAGATGDLLVTGVGTGAFSIVVHCTKHGVIDTNVT